MGDDAFAEFWATYSPNLRADLTDEMKEGIRVCCWFAWSAGLNRGRAEWQAETERSISEGVE